MHINMNKVRNGSKQGQFLLMSYMDDLIWISARAQHTALELMLYNKENDKVNKSCKP